MTELSIPLLGREHELSHIGALLDRGLVVVVYGRVGVGKSTLLRALARRARQVGRPCALAARTLSLSDFTKALARAYPRVSTSGPQRHIRGRLRMAMEKQPGVLLFDDLGQTGTAFKGAIRSVRGTGLGVVLAADADHPRDHERIRALALSHYEIELRPLHGNSMRALLDRLVAHHTLAGTLTADHLRDLVAATEGLPGRAIEFAEALTRPESWSAGRPRIDWLRASAAIRASERYRVATSYAE